MFDLRGQQASEPAVRVWHPEIQITYWEMVIPRGWTFTAETRQRIIDRALVFEVLAEELRQHRASAGPFAVTSRAAPTPEPALSLPHCDTPQTARFLDYSFGTADSAAAPFCHQQETDETYGYIKKCAYFAITAAGRYRGKSLEELRLEDYVGGRRFSGS